MHVPQANAGEALQAQDRLSYATISSMRVSFLFALFFHHVHAVTPSLFLGVPETCMSKRDNRQICTHRMMHIPRGKLLSNPISHMPIYFQALFLHHTRLLFLKQWNQVGSLGTIYQGNNSRDGISPGPPYKRPRGTSAGSSL